jgi:hypothetical protein
MPYDGDDRDRGDDNGDDWKKPRRETITHRHPSLPFIEITQTRYAEERTAEDDRCETWGFEILGPMEAEGYPLAYDGVAHTRGDHTEAEMTADMTYRAEKHMLDDRGPFFVLRIYFETGEYRQEIDAVMRKHGQSPLWRRAEAAVMRRVGVERGAIRLRYRLRGRGRTFNVSAHYAVTVCSAPKTGSSLDAEAGMDVD